MPDDFWRDITDHHKKLDAVFMRLCAEPCLKVPAIGDRVLVAAGLLGMGFPWVRLEAEVIEAGDTAYKVRFFGKEAKVQWVHQALITDVLSRQGAIA